MRPRVGVPRLGAWDTFHITIDDNYVTKCNITPNNVEVSEMIIDCEATYKLKPNTQAVVGVLSDRMIQGNLRVAMVDTDDMTALVKPVNLPPNVDEHAWVYIDDLIKVEED